MDLRAPTGELRTRPGRGHSATESQAFVPARRAAWVATVLVASDEVPAPQT